MVIETCPILLIHSGLFIYALRYTPGFRNFDGASPKRHLAYVALYRLYIGSTSASQTCPILLIHSGLFIYALRYTPGFRNFDGASPKRHLAYVALYRLYIGSTSASATACPLRGYGRAGTQNDRGEDTHVGACRRVYRNVCGHMPHTAQRHSSRRSKRVPTTHMCVR